MNHFTKIRSALEHARDLIPEYCGIRTQYDDAFTALAELERAAAEPVAWMWNDELGIPHASAGSKKPVWLESSASAEYIKQTNLRPLYTAPPPAPVAEMREPTDEECTKIFISWSRTGTATINGAEIKPGRAIFNAVAKWVRGEL